MTGTTQGWVKRRERYGDLGMRRSFAQRFEDSYTPEPNSGCWLSLGTPENNGYVRLPLRRKNISAHRAAWELFKGPIPQGMKVLHRCDVRCCVNPDHLFLGTHADNMDDMVAKGRQCRGGASHKAKLTEQQVLTIRDDGRKLRVIAADYGVSPITVSHIKRGKTWKHLWGENP